MPIVEVLLRAVPRLKNAGNSFVVCGVRTLEVPVPVGEIFNSQPHGGGRKVSLAFRKFAADTVNIVFREPES